MLQLGVEYFKKLIFSLKFVFIINLIIFIFLLFRNPFGIRTLIPNLEPFPDVMTYLSSARSLSLRGPFAVGREGRYIENSAIPYLYPISLVPFYLMNNDVRMFYIANVIFSLISFIILFKILKTNTSNVWIVGLTLFLFVTNYYIYWYPQWGMTENILLPLFLLGVLFLLQKVSIINIIIACFISISFYATKYACIPMTLSYFIAYFIKILYENKFHNKSKIVIIYLLLVVSISLPTLIYGYLMGGLNPFSLVESVIKSILPQTNQVGTIKQISDSTNSWFSFSYFQSHLIQYFSALLGSKNRFLWDFTPIIPKWIGIVGSLGLILGLVGKRFRLITFALIAMLISQIIFMSFFYAFDARYIYCAIPTLLIGFSILLFYLHYFLVKNKLSLFFYLFVIMFFGVYFFQNAMRLKYQVVLNLKYAETPWYYISVLKLNNYFKQLSENKPVVISPMPPYYIDFYSNGNYTLLPLSLSQEFRDHLIATWGDNDYSNLISLYSKYLRGGKEVYVSTYGLGNEGYLHSAFDDIQKNFKLTLVYEDCYKQCNLYKLNLKP